MQINNLSHESFIFLCLQILTMEFKGSVFAIFKIYHNPWKTILIFHLFRILTSFAASIFMHERYGSKALKRELCGGQGSGSFALKPDSTSASDPSAAVQPIFLANTCILKASQCNSCA